MNNDLVFTDFGADPPEDWPTPEQLLQGEPVEYHGYMQYKRGVGGIHYDFWYMQDPTSDPYDASRIPDIAATRRRWHDWYGQSLTLPRHSYEDNKETFVVCVGEHRYAVTFYDGAVIVNREE